MQEQIPLTLKNKVRVVTAASLFDGHDAAINIMRRIIQASGAEVIHLGHNRSVEEIVNCAIQEDAQCIAFTSYQGGHVEFLKFMYDSLRAKNSPQIKICGGGGGTILPSEIEDLHQYGIDKIYTPDDGRALGLQGMINDLLQRCDFPTGKNISLDIRKLQNKDMQHIATLISSAENDTDTFLETRIRLENVPQSKVIPILGITGTGGAGKSSLTDELTRRFLIDFPDKTLAIISVDPSRRKTGGALLGDRIRMNSIHNPRVFMRSMATRSANASISKAIRDAILILKAAAYDMIIVETSGIGQSGSEIVDIADTFLYVMTPEYGAASQLEKIDMLDYADIIAINKFDKRGAVDAMREVRKQYQRNHNLWHEDIDKMPVLGTIASHFNDRGTNMLYKQIMAFIDARFHLSWKSALQLPEGDAGKINIIPPERVRYLSEIVKNNKYYDENSEIQASLLNHWQALEVTKNIIEDSHSRDHISKEIVSLKNKIDPESIIIINEWDKKKRAYASEAYSYKVRDKEIKINTHSESLSHSQVPKVSLPKYYAWGDILRWNKQENVPGEFPYTAGVFPFKREGEDPTRMFAGEGGPERTNKRFHYVSLDMPAKRLSTAFDSVTLYGNDPAIRPDIYGKIGNSGVSICTLDDAKKLYSGFDLCHTATSVSMTINGPAPTLCAFFMHAAIDQQCEKYIKEHGLTNQVKDKIAAIFAAKKLPPPSYFGNLPEGNDGLGLLLLGVTGDQVLDKSTYDKIKSYALSQVRGTVQADIFKEDQAQNTCIFSTEFSLKLQGDMQEYFIQNQIKNFYSVSISGYHMAEAGANPITQLAFTLANGFSFIEYYISRGMHIDDFAPNFSFFFSNGIDPEYAVIGRVARRIWAKAIKYYYNGNDRSQKLKYHIQTSGRSLHAQEIDFNDIRTTLQALYAIYDNCNSLHTNAYDEAITTPTEESVRRAMAIQLIINKELGLAKNENPLQGSFIIEELTALVEEAVYTEFERLTERGGVLGAMETMYQRSKIQEESMYYETLKHTGEYPIIGVNTFLSAKGSPTIMPLEVIRSTNEEKQRQIDNLAALHVRNNEAAIQSLQNLREAAIHNKNMFEELMEAVKYCSLGQITNALFEVGGQYRRNM
jgi:methylmalonyl-CoA mutase